MAGAPESPGRWDCPHSREVPERRVAHPLPILPVHSGPIAGSMRHRGPDSWELRVHAGRDSSSGRKLYVTRPVGGGKREAGRALVRLVTEVEQGIMAGRGGTLCELATAVDSDLRERAGPSIVHDIYDQQNLDRFDRILDAIDTWTAWNNGYPVNVDVLIRTVTTLTDPGLRGRLPGNTSDVVRPLTDWLQERGLGTSSQRVGVERDVGIDR